jgi:hypothetical protein
MQADEGCDFRFLQRSKTAGAPGAAEEAAEMLPLNF